MDAPSEFIKNVVDMMKNETPEFQQWVLRYVILIKNGFSDEKARSILTKFV